MSDTEFVIYVKQQQAAGLKQSDLVQSMLNEGNGISRARTLHLNGVYGSKKGNLFVVDGKEVSREEFNQIKPEAIASAKVMDVGPAKKAFGEKGRYGATVVETKQDSVAISHFIRSKGYPYQGIDRRDHYYMKHAYLRLVR